MNKITKNSFIIAALLVTVILSGNCRAEESATKQSANKCFTAIEFFTGFGKAKLHAQGNYHFAPFIVALDFDIKPPIERLLEKVGLKYPGLMQFQLEPFINSVYSPYANIEVGNSFMLKLGILPETSKFQPYVKAGIGMLYMSQHTREQSTQYNFLPQGGAGLMYFLKDNLALTLGYRYRHLSNNSFKSPNSGINVDMYLAGISIVY